MSSSRRRILRSVAYTLAAFLVLVLGAIGYVLVTWDRPFNRAVVPMVTPRTPEVVARGAHLYERSMLCWTCHGSEGSLRANEPQAGGREFDLTGIGPGFGYVYGSNLTPDRETGIGAWSDGELVRAIREGVNRQGGVIFPVMAYQFYHGLSDYDALALVAYMRSPPPENHRVPARRLSFAAKALIAIGVLTPNAAITTRRQAPPAGATLEYGTYLAWHASGCAECHTPRSPKNGKVDEARPLAGGLFPFPEEGFSTTGSNLTPDPTTGLGRWTEQQFLTAVRTGVRPDGRVLLPFMPWPSYSEWSEQEVQAIWLYLRSLHPIVHQVPPTQFAAAGGKGKALSGAALYAIYCRACHGEKGSGSPLVSAALEDATVPLSAADVSKVIAEGLPGTRMPGFQRTLTPGQIEDLAGFVRRLRTGK
jgi:mono/diheme cytochrome c family protein